MKFIDTNSDVLICRLSGFMDYVNENDIELTSEVLSFYEEVVRKIEDYVEMEFECISKCLRKKQSKYSINDLSDIADEIVSDIRYLEDYVDYI